MAWSLIGTGGFDDGDVATLTLPAGIQSGDITVAGLAFFNGDAPASPSGWTHHVTAQNPTGIALASYTRAHAGAESGTTDFVASTFGGIVLVWATYRSTAGPAAFGQATANSGATDTAVATGVTTAAADTLVLHAATSEPVGFGSGATIAAPVGFTQDVHHTLARSELLTAALARTTQATAGPTGDVSAPITNGGDDWAAQLIVIAIDTGGGGPVVLDTGGSGDGSSTAAMAAETSRVLTTGGASAGTAAANAGTSSTVATGMVAAGASSAMTGSAVTLSTTGAAIGTSSATLATAGTSTLTTSAISAGTSTSIASSVLIAALRAESSGDSTASAGVALTLTTGGQAHGAATATAAVDGPAVAVPRLGELTRTRRASITASRTAQEVTSTRNHRGRMTATRIVHDRYVATARMATDRAVAAARAAQPRPVAAARQARERQVAVTRTNQEDWQPW